MIKAIKTLLLLVPLFVLAGCFNDDTATVRFKAITVLEVDGVEKEFYSVLQTRIKLTPKSTIGFNAKTRLWREATVLDLGERGRAYVIHTHFKPDAVGGSSIYPAGLLKSYGLEWTIGRLEEKDLSELKSVSGRVPLDYGNRTPVIVYFEDETDQNSVKYLDKNDLSAAFGEDVKLKGFYLEITDNSVTDGKILEYLPWLKLENYKKFEGRPKGPLPDKWRDHKDRPFVWKMNRNLLVINEQLRKIK